MRFIIGLIVGVAVTIGGAYVHDNSEGTKPLVNWTTAAELQQSTFEFASAQFTRIRNWASSKSSP